MWLGSVTNGIGTWLKGRLAWLALGRSRRHIIIGLGIAVLFLIWTLSKLLPHHRKGRFPEPPAYDQVCLKEVLRKWSHAEQESDVVIIHNPLQETDHPHLPFVGNGKIGLIAKDGYFLFLSLGQSITWTSLPFSPLVTSFTASSSKPREATVLDMKQGLVHLIKSYSYVSNIPELATGQGCVIVENIIFAHRSRPSVLVQEINVVNHGEATVQVSLQYSEPNPDSWSSATTKTYGFHDKSVSPTKTYYKLTCAKVTNVDLPVNITIATTMVPPELTVETQKTNSLQHFTVVHTSHRGGLTTPPPIHMEDLQKETAKELQDLVSMKNPADLRTSHMQAWRELSETGIHVDPRHDPDTPSGLEVNATVYYVLSSFLSPGSNLASSSRAEKDETEKLLHTPDHCFSGPPTMHSASLWSTPKTEAGVTKIAAAWQRLLEKNGCLDLVRAGARGVVQSLTLSFGGLQFSAGHFEFAMNPASLHTSLAFRHVYLYGDVHIYLSVVVNEESGHAEKMILRAQGADKSPLFACEAGCQYDPIEVGPSPVVFPVRMTRPVTPLLYISHNKSELIELRKHVFIKEAHAESLKNHHVYHHTGLPAKFWVTIAFFIVGFHLYLAKLIYGECFKESKSKVYVS